MAGTLWPRSLDLAKKLKSARSRVQTLVKDDQIDPAVGDLVQSFLSRRGGDDGEAGPLQPKLLQAGDARIILHEQDRCLILQCHALVIPQGVF